MEQRLEGEDSAAYALNFATAQVSWRGEYAVLHGVLGSLFGAGRVREHHPRHDFGLGVITLRGVMETWRPACRSEPLGTVRVVSTCGSPLETSSGATSGGQRPR